MRKQILIRLFALSLICALALSVTGCGDKWEKATYATLSSSGSVIKQARAEYRNGTISRTESNREILEKAKDAHSAAVHAFAFYIEAKVALEVVKGDAQEEAQAQAKLDTALQHANGSLAELAAVVADVRKLTK
jgi:hypothetical protein